MDRLLPPRRIELDGRQIEVKNYRQIVRAGIAYLSEDRRREGLVLLRSVADNICLASMEKVLVRGVLSSRKEKEYAQKYIDKLSIKTPGRNTLARNLSGGNQQKVVVAKWLMRNANILILMSLPAGLTWGKKRKSIESCLNWFKRASLLY